MEERNRTTEFGEVITVDETKQYWADWFSQFVGARIVGVKLLHNDGGIAPVLVVQRQQLVPLHEDPEDVMCTSLGRTGKLPVARKKERS